MTDLLVPAPDPQPGDLWLTRSEGMIGALIRFGERVKYHGWLRAFGRAWQTMWHRAIPEDPTDPCWANHVAVYVDDGHLIEALARGLTLSPASKYAPGTFRVLHLVASDDERAALVHFARVELAKHARYGWLGILSIVVQLLTPTRLDLSWDGTMICSAFGARCWEHAGQSIPTLSPFTTMPADLAFYAGALPA